MAEEAIHKKNLATLPTFYGNKEQDSIKAEDLIRRIETNMKDTTLKWTDEMAFLYFEMALKGRAIEWLYMEKMMIPNHLFTNFRNRFLLKYGDRLDYTRIYEKYNNLKYDPEMPVETYIYNHLHYYQSVNDLGGRDEYKNSIKDATLKATFDATDEEHVGLFEAGRLFENNLICKSAIISRLPDKLRYQFDNYEAKDLDVQKISKKIETYRMRHSKKAVSTPKVAAVQDQDSDSDDDQVEAVSQKQKKWNTKKNGFRKFSQNKNKSSGTNQNQSQGERRPFCLYCKRDGHIQDNCFKRKGDNAPCYSQKGKAYFPRNTNEVSEGQNKKPTVEAIDSNHENNSVFPY